MLCSRLQVAAGRASAKARNGAEQNVQAFSGPAVACCHSVLRGEVVLDLVEGAAECEGVKEAQQAVTGVSDPVLRVARDVYRRTSGDSVFITVDEECAFSVHDVVDLRGRMSVMSKPPARPKVGHTSRELGRATLRTEDRTKSDLPADLVRPCLWLDVGFFDDQCVAHGFGSTTLVWLAACDRCQFKDRTSADL